MATNRLTEDRAVVGLNAVGRTRLTGTKPGAWMRYGFAALLLVVAFAVTAQAQQSFEDGIAAYRREDYATALQIFRPLAEQGDAKAQIGLGTLYHEGLGVRRDDDESMKWFRRAAKQGLPKGQYGVGLSYYRGWGVEQDYGEAMKWFRRAADQGLAEAQYYIGEMHHFGRSVTQDYGEAAKWWREAAEQGEGSAQNNLGALYERGEGVLQDYVQAHKWFNLATTANSPSGEKPDSAVRNRDKLRRKMTAVQVAKAQRLAREWRARRQARPTAGSALKKYGTGSGFFVSLKGHLVTNAHVVSDCAEVRFPVNNQSILVSIDEASDLALYRTGAPPEGFASFRKGRSIRQGEDVVVVGYPLSGVLASGPIVTTGSVSALAGPGDDGRIIQITAPVQHGNSGGPLLDHSGNVVGVVVAKLNALKIASVTGDIPQNVNFALSEGTVRAFLNAHNVPYLTEPSEKELDVADIAAKARRYTVLVECWK